MAVLSDRANFSLPPANVDFKIGGQRIYFRSNMEFVDGMLNVAHGGTGNTSFTENRVVIYSNGRLISSDITTVQLATVKKPGVRNIFVQKNAPTKDCAPLDLWINL